MNTLKITVNHRESDNPDGGFSIDATLETEGSKKHGTSTCIHAHYDVHLRCNGGGMSDGIQNIPNIVSDIVSSIVRAYIVIGG